jgi:hypothetical protein
VKSSKLRAEKLKSKRKLNERRIETSNEMKAKNSKEGNDFGKIK